VTIKLVLYFLLGGSVVAAVSYFGSQGKGMMAAFISNLPVITLLTLFTVYINGGVVTSVSFLKGILLLLPAWVIYVIAVIVLLPRIGIIPAAAIGVFLYVGGALLTIKLFQ
jgi:hypothetical protein